jgi:Helix-turn-helix.
MGMTEKIKILLIKKNITAVQLAEMLNSTPQNVYNKFKRDNFSEKELIEIADKLGVKYEGSFILDNGDRI